MYVERLSRTFDNFGVRENDVPALSATPEKDSRRAASIPQNESNSDTSLNEGGGREPAEDFCIFLNLEFNKK